MGKQVGITVRYGIDLLNVDRKSSCAILLLDKNQRRVPRAGARANHPCLKHVPDFLLDHPFAMLTVGSVRAVE